MKDIIVAVICSGAFFSFVQFLIQRWDTKKSVVRKIDSLTDSFEKYKAELSRTHILRFDDDLHNQVYHSEEYFKQTIADIDTYERYCDKHKDFTNGLTVMASEHIKSEYKRLYLDGDNKND